MQSMMLSEKEAKYSSPSLEDVGEEGTREQLGGYDDVDVFGHEEDHQVNSPQSCKEMGNG